MSRIVLLALVTGLILSALVAVPVSAQEGQPLTYTVEAHVPVQIELKGSAASADIEPNTVTVTLKLRHVVTISGTEIVSSTFDVSSLDSSSGAQVAATDVEEVTAHIAVTATREGLTQEPEPSVTGDDDIQSEDPAGPTAQKVTVVANRNANLREGPGTSFPVVGSVRQGQSLALVGQNHDESWYLLEDGAWIVAFVVDGIATELPSRTRTEADAFMQLGEDLYVAGDFEGALAAFTAAIVAEPDDPKAYVNRAGTYIFMKDNESAIRDCNTALELNPNMATAYHNRANAYNNRASAYENMGDIDKAVNEYTKAFADATRAIELDPRSAISYALRGGVYEGLQDYANAVADYETFLKLEPESPYRDQIEQQLNEARGKIDE